MSMKKDEMITSLFEIEFKKDGANRKYQIPAKSEMDALVRLGQIYGDGRDYREDVKIEVLKIKNTQRSVHFTEVVLSPMAGSHILSAFHDAQFVARSIGADVMLKFNGSFMKVSIDSEYEDVYNSYMNSDEETE